MSIQKQETTNRERLTVMMHNVSVLLSDIKEKNDMIDAGECHRAEWSCREDDLAECQTILEDMNKMLDRLDYLL